MHGGDLIPVQLPGEHHTAQAHGRRLTHAFQVVDGHLGGGVQGNEGGDLAAKADPYCNTRDRRILSQVLNNYDQETTDFYEWTVSYTVDELSALIRRKSGIDFGRILDLVPLSRGASGRIIILKIVGEKCTVEVGKELEIRKWLSESHLYSSAFDVEKTVDGFVLKGKGWGHGVGLCQIGAAVMGDQGIPYEEILSFYYPQTELTKKW